MCALNCALATCVVRELYLTNAYIHLDMYMSLDMIMYTINEHILFVNAERHGLKDAKKVEDLQMKVIDALRDHCTYNSEAQKKPQLLSRILGRIPELRSLSSLAVQRMEMLRNRHSLPAALNFLF